MNAKINLPSMMIGVIAGLLGAALFAYDAAAQTAKDLVGTWTSVSITAVQGDQLSSRQIDNTKDLGELVPNLQFSPVAPSSGNAG